MEKTETKSANWKRRLKTWSVELGVILVLILGIEAFLASDSLGVAAPNIESLNLSNQPFSLQQFDGEPAVVHFWATWCPVCEVEQGTIDNLADGVPLITVAMLSGDAGEVRAYMKDQGVDYPVINDKSGLLSQRYGVKAVPASFILDREGKIRFATRGYTTEWGLRARLWLAGLY